MTPALEDRFSELPAEIIHDILRRLDSPEEAARTSVLSRTWHRQIWRSYPVVEYRDSSEQFSYSTFASFASSSSARIRTYFAPNGIPLSAFRILLRNSLKERRRQLDELLKSSFSMAAICGSPIEISIEILDDYYSINSPLKLLRNFSRTRNLKLRGCLIYADNVPNLESVTLLDTPIYTCADRLEINLFNMNEIRLSNAPLLETLALRFDHHKLIRIMLSSSSAAPNLKAVTISCHPKVTQDDIDALTFNLPSLESLSFDNSKFAGGKCWLRVSPNSKLNKFSLTDCFSKFNPPKKIKIDAPNLATLAYNQRGLKPRIHNIKGSSITKNTRRFDVMRWHLVMDRNSFECCSGYTCWRHRLKDAKIKKNKCETMEISEAIYPSLSAKENLSSNTFVLTWDDERSSILEASFMCCFQKILASHYSLFFTGLMLLSEHLFDLKLSSSSSAPNLKAVTISNHQELKQRDIDSLTSDLPSLQSLSFESSKFEGRKCWLRVPSNSSKLTEFSLTDCSSRAELLQEIKIDAPNLAIFAYTETYLYRLTRHVDIVSSASNFRFAVAVSTADFQRTPNLFFQRVKESLAPLLRSLQLSNVVLKLQGSSLQVASNCFVVFCFLFAVSL
ncbi:hypothetical protein LINGRAHAP2_LOCUS33864 [Linum grandiflorum]